MVGPRIALRVGTATRHAVYASGSPGTALVFEYEVAEGDADGDGIAVGANALRNHGGSAVALSADGTAATLDHAAVAASASHRVDGVRPAVDRASVSGTALAITFEEALGAAASLANSAFTVKRTRAGTEETVSLSGSPSISGAVVTLTLAQAVVATDTGVKVSYEAPTTGSGNRIVDAAGNEAAGFDDEAVRNASGPVVAVSSGAGADVTYAIGDTISLKATFPEAVTVTTGMSGAEVVGPRIALRVGTATGHAVYASGSSGTALVFEYEVAEGDADGDGIAVGANALRNHGGSAVALSADGTAATLDHAAVAASASHRVDGVRPAVDRASVSGTALAITFEEALGAAASLANSAFTVKRTRAGTEETVSLSGSPSISGAVVTLTLAQAVVATDTGVKVSYEAPTTGSGNRIVDAVGNEAADFDDETVTNAGGPVVAVSSGAGADDTYTIGDTISLTATFAEAVTVTPGTSGAEVVGPRIALQVGTAPRHAVYASGSPGTVLEFELRGGRGRRRRRRDRGGGERASRTTAEARSS